MVPLWTLHFSLMFARVFSPVEELSLFLFMWCARLCPVLMFLWDDSPLNIMILSF